MMYERLVDFDARSVPFSSGEEHMQARRDAIRRLMLQSRRADGDGFPSRGRIRL